jgi:hypothetical protein
MTSEVVILNRNYTSKIALFVVMLTGIHSAFASTIHVPADQPTIQAAIDAAVNGDIVLVSAGTYVENINFKGKAITVRSQSGPSTTIIDGGAKNSVVIFASGETRASVLKGFTLTRGNAQSGGGILVSSSPTIVGNIIRNNHACSFGGGIAVSFSSPLIRANWIVANSEASNCSGGGGGGISVVGSASAEIVGNRILNNSFGVGGGIELFYAGTPLLLNNVIKGNSAVTQGGGISLVNATAELLIQNLIYQNRAPTGGGMYFTGGSAGPFLVNNTFADNNGSQLGSALFAFGSATHTVLSNNIFVGTAGTTAIYCDLGGFIPTFNSNDSYSPNGTGFGGDCAGESQKDGNLIVDPMFLNEAGGVYQLLPSSPLVDMGTNATADLPGLDFVRRPRIVDGNADGTATVDMGAYEFQ